MTSAVADWTTQEADALADRYARADESSSLRRAAGDDLAPVPGDLADPSTEPPPMACEGCGAPIPPQWWPGGVGRLAGKVWPGRWCRGASRCSSCVERTVLERQTHARIPERYRDYRLALHHFARQRPDEDARAFRARIRQEPGTFGVSATNHGAWKRLRAWKPSPGCALYIQGPVGTGKTAAAAAIATALLAEDRPAYVEELSETELRRRYGDRADAARAIGAGRRVRPAVGGWSLVWTDEADLLRRADPATDEGEREIRGHVVVLDDLGTECSREGKRAEWARDLVQRLVRQRYDRRQPMILTSNARIDQLGKVPGAGLDARTVDRLREMCRDVVELVGDSWRAP